MSIDDKELRAALRPLGRTVNGVRKKLQTLGITGVPEEPTFCVVAEYLARQFPVEEVLVTGGTITVNGACVTPGMGVQDFIGNFDDAVYPELIRHKDACTGVVLTQETDEDGEYDIEVSCSCMRVCQYFPPQEKAEARRFLKMARKGAFPAAQSAGAV